MVTLVHLVEMVSLVFREEMEMLVTLEPLVNLVSLVVMDAGDPQEQMVCPDVMETLEPQDVTEHLASQVQ